MNATDADAQRPARRGSGLAVAAVIVGVLSLLAALPVTALIFSYGGMVIAGMLDQWGAPALVAIAVGLVVLALLGIVLGVLALRAGQSRPLAITAIVLSFLLLVPLVVQIAVHAQMVAAYSPA